MSRSPIKRTGWFEGVGAFAGLLEPLRASTSMRKLGNEELLTCSFAVDSMTASAIEGVRVLGELIQGYDAKHGPLDCNNTGALLTFLGAMLTELGDLHFVATDELAARGYTCLGSPIEPSTQEPRP